MSKIVRFQDMGCIGHQRGENNPNIYFASSMEQNGLMTNFPRTLSIGLLFE
jgi:hypothetical protein